MADLTIVNETICKDRSKSVASGKANCDHKIKPDLSNKFRPSEVRELMREIMKQSLDNVKYDYDQMPGFIAII